MRLAILGYGNMGRAIANALRSLKGDSLAIVAYDKVEACRNTASREVAVEEPVQWFAGASGPDAIIIAVKPQDIGTALRTFKELDQARLNQSLWLSIAAGISIRTIQELLGAELRVCRAMPNTPAMIGEGMTGYAMSGTCSEKDALLAESVFNSCGRSVQVPEKLLNAITGVSGSGPAYVFLFVESLIEAGVTWGLPYETAKTAAIQTVRGAAALLDRLEEPPGVLKGKVMSPGGTTAAALKELEKHAFKYGIIKAVEAAARKAEELQ